MRYETMCRKYSRIDWTRYAANDASPTERTAMERHAADCATCADERYVVEIVFQQARSLSVPSAQTETARERVWQAVRKDIRPAIPQRRSLIPGSWDFGGAAVVIMLLIIVACLCFPGAPVQPTVAFAEVEAAMSKVDTATWTVTIRLPRPNPLPPRYVGEMSAECRASLNPPRLKQEFTLSTRQALQMDFRTVSDGQYTLGYINMRTPQYVRGEQMLEEIDVSAKTPRDRIQSLLIFPQDEALHGPLQVADTILYAPQIKRIRHRSAWKSRKDTLNGKEVIRFESSVTIATLSSQGAKKQTRPYSRWTIWADPTTYRILRREIVHPGIYGWTMISDNFRYNVRLPDKSFQLPPPPVGTPYQYFDATRAGRERARVTPQEIAQIQNIIQQSVSAWNRHDRAAFTALWDFRFEETEAALFLNRAVNEDRIRANERKWLGQMEKGEPFRTWPKESLDNARTTTVWYVRRTESDPFPPDGTRPTIYHVSTRGIQRIPQSGTIYASSFRLRRIGDNFRLISMYTRQPSVKPPMSRSGTATRPAGRR
jgi:outer membrane lipoprotein-sorting protein